MYSVYLIFISILYSVIEMRMVEIIIFFLIKWLTDLLCILNIEKNNTFAY